MIYEKRKFLFDLLEVENFRMYLQVTHNLLSQPKFQCA